MRAYRYRDGSRARSSVASANRCTSAMVVPSSRRSSARLRLSSTSSVRAIVAKARLDGLICGQRSRTATSRPARDRSPAIVRPVGPPPTTTTSTCSMTRAPAMSPSVDIDGTPLDTASPRSVTYPISRDRFGE
ncbi:pentachlorophenol monooxygenase domain protein [Rhodococcus sp. MTM3W5.2]|nr:pentachlorophenol monooxygenase domain protein [Rhodococcus sp. MTM3W5.2]